MSALKVGDRVCVARKVDPSWIGYVTELDEHVGCVGTVAELGNPGGDEVQVDGECGDWWYPLDVLERVDDLLTLEPSNFHREATQRAAEAIDAAKIAAERQRAEADERLARIDALLDVLADYDHAVPATEHVLLLELRDLVALALGRPVRT